MVRCTIDWSTTTVSRGAAGFDLRVELGAAASTDWQTCFNQLAEQDALTAHGRSWGMVCISDRTITMQHLEPEARERVRAYLGEIVERTNVLVAAKLDEAERERVRAEREEAELMRAAEELAGWFRSSPTPAAGGQNDRSRHEGLGENGERGGDRVEDLRNRLKHAFGTGVPGAEAS
jgi:hypothetical protein